jgi:L-ribulose-5-phosphate 3-epimerase
VATPRISFMTANYAARQLDWNMTQGWSEGETATNRYFEPRETYASRFDEIARDAREAGFAAIDIWSAHLNAAWATDEHVAAAREALTAHGLTVTSLHGGMRERDQFVRTCEIANALATEILGGATPLLADDRDWVVARLREHGLRLAFENHPEASPDEMLAKIGDDDAGGLIGTAVDTGWYATQSCDPVQAIERLNGRIFHVHLKDVLAAGAHETCRWGKGVVPVEECVRALERVGYEGDYMVEHEPEHYDPLEDCRDMRQMLEAWIGGGR